MAAVYAAQADVERAAGGLQRLLQIADFDGDGKLDTGLVDEALLQAEALINSYVRKQREVPLPVPIPDLIRSLAAELAVYNLKRWRDALTEQDAMTHEQRIAWLESFARGKVTLGVSPAPPASPHNKPSASERPTSKAVSRENLKGFS